MEFIVAKKLPECLIGNISEIKIKVKGIKSLAAYWFIFIDFKKYFLIKVS